MAWTMIARQVLKDDRGTSAVELGLICALIVMVMLSALESFAGENERTWNLVSNKMKEASSSNAG